MYRILRKVFTIFYFSDLLDLLGNRWDHVLAGISVDRPDDKMLCALFYEQVREFRCLELDM